MRYLYYNKFRTARMQQFSFLSNLVLIAVIIHVPFKCHQIESNYQIQKKFIHNRNVSAFNLHVLWLTFKVDQVSVLLTSFSNPQNFTQRFGQHNACLYKWTVMFVRPRAVFQNNLQVTKQKCIYTVRNSTDMCPSDKPGLQLKKLTIKS